MMINMYTEESQINKKLPSNNFGGVQAIEDVDTIENLIHHLYSQTQDHKDATINLRYNLLGSFPSDPIAEEKNPSPEGLINQMRAVLKLAIRNMNETRDHISYISKDVR